MQDDNVRAAVFSVAEKASTSAPVSPRFSLDANIAQVWCQGFDILVRREDAALQNMGFSWEVLASLRLSALGPAGWWAWH